MGSTLVLVAGLLMLVDDRALTTSVRTAAQKRDAIVRFIWGAGGLPKGIPAAIEKNPASPVNGLKNVAGVETFTIRMESGQENTTHHFLPRRKNGSLVVLHHGHACSFDDMSDAKTYGMAHAIDTLLSEGYGVLAAYMPHMRPGDCRTLPHEKMFDLPVSTGSALKFFLEPVTVSLNALRNQYKRIHMAGLSGGGWTTTMYAAVDPSVRMSFSVAGTMPLYLRTGGSVGDKEQFLDEFYRIAGYPDLYLLGADRAGRKQVQILNRRDDCCFGEAQHDAERSGAPYEPALRVYEKVVQQAVGPKRFRLVIDESAPRHMISEEAVRIMLREMR